MCSCFICSQDFRVYSSYGGVVIIWNTRCVSVLESVVGVYLVSIKIMGINGNDWWLSRVYETCYKSALI